MFQYKIVSCMIYNTAATQKCIPDKDIQGRVTILFGGGMFMLRPTLVLLLKQIGHRQQPAAVYSAPFAAWGHLLVFQIWTVSGSSMPCFSAMSSRKSKKYRTAMGGGRLVLRMATNTSSTNFCRVPWGGGRTHSVHCSYIQVQSIH